MKLFLSFTLFILLLSSCMVDEPTQEAIDDSFAIGTPVPGNPEPQCYQDSYKIDEKDIVRKIDLLFVPDTSGSIVNERGRVADGIDAFVEALPSEIDYRIGVMLAHSGNSSWSGKLFYKSGPPVLDSQIYSIDQIRSYLSDVMRSPVTDSFSDGGEVGMYSLNRGITSNLESIKSQGFFREDAALVIVFIADEQDVCAEFPEGVIPVPDPQGAEDRTYAKYCIDGEGNRLITPEMVYNNIKAINGDYPLLIGGVLYDEHSIIPTGNEDEIGYGYLDMVGLGNGINIDLGSGDYRDGLSRLGRLATSKVSAPNQFVLKTDSPDLNSFEVLVDGAAVDFTYDDINHEIVLKEERDLLSIAVVKYCTKAPGLEITIDPRSLSEPTPGLVTLKLVKRSDLKTTKALASVGDFELIQGLSTLTVFNGVYDILTANGNYSYGSFTVENDQITEIAGAFGFNDEGVLVSGEYAILAGVRIDPSTLSKPEGLIDVFVDEVLAQWKSSVETLHLPSGTYELSGPNDVSYGEFTVSGGQVVSTSGSLSYDPQNGIEFLPEAIGAVRISADESVSWTIPGVVETPILGDGTLAISDGVYQIDYQVGGESYSGTLEIVDGVPVTAGIPEDNPVIAFNQGSLMEDTEPPFITIFPESGQTLDIYDDVTVQLQDWSAIDYDRIRFQLNGHNIPESLVSIDQIMNIATIDFNESFPLLDDQMNIVSCLASDEYLNVTEYANYYYPVDPGRESSPPYFSFDPRGGELDTLKPTVVITIHDESEIIFDSWDITLNGQGINAEIITADPDNNQIILEFSDQQYLKDESVNILKIVIEDQYGNRGYGAIGFDTINHVITDMTPSRITGGSSHTCLIYGEGKVRCWGNGPLLGNGEWESIGDDEAVRNGIDVSLGEPANAIANGQSHSCALLESGNVRCWGANWDGQLGLGHTEDVIQPLSYPVIDLGEKSIGIAAGHRHSCALLESGTIRCWGSNSSGQLGLGHTDTIGDDETVISAQAISFDEPAIGVTAGGAKSCALFASGNVQCWGDNSSGSLGTGDDQNIGDDELPQSIPLMNVPGHVVQIEQGTFHGCLLTQSGEVYCWGGNNSGELGLGQVPGQNTPVDPVSLGEAATQIVVWGEHSCALLESSSVRCWGRNELGQLGLAHTQNVGTYDTPADHPYLSLGGEVESLAAGEFHACAILKDENIRCWGSNDLGQLGLGDRVPVGDNEFPDEREALAFSEKVVQVASGYSATCALFESGSVRCWSYWSVSSNSSMGILGQGQGYPILDNMGAADFKNIELGESAVKIAVGRNSACAILTSGALRCWGDNYYHEDGYGVGLLGLGDPNINDVGVYEKPSEVAPVSLGAKAVDVSLGETHVCAVLEDGHIRCWGSNSRGQLGLGNRESVGASNRPIDVEPIWLGEKAIQVVTGRFHTCALTVSNKMYCWGDNEDGQLGLGNGSPDPVEIPALVDVGDDVSKIAAGIFNSCALTISGSVRCWGRGSALGLGMDGYRESIGAEESPSAYPSLTLGDTATDIAVGLFHACALLNSGDVRCWGDSSQKGELGSGNNGAIGDNEYPADVDPVRLGGSATAISSSSQHTCALLTNGTLRCWGANDAGQLGHPLYVYVGNDEHPSDVPFVDYGNQPLVAQFDFNPSVGPAPLEVSFDASASTLDGAILGNASYDWDFGDGETYNSDLSTVTHIFQDPGVYQVFLTITDESGVVATTSRMVNVEYGDVNPVANLTLVNSQGFIDYSDGIAHNAMNVTLDASESSASFGDIVRYVYECQGNRGTVDTDESIILCGYQVPGVYYVSVTVYDSKGRSSTSPDQPVIVRAENFPPEANFSCTINDLNVHCVSHSRDYDGELSGYSWQVQGYPGVYHQDLDITFDDYGDYNITHYAWDESFVQSTITKTVSLIKPNSPPVVDYVMTPQAGKAPLQVSFDGTMTSDTDGTIIFYFWDFGDGTTATGPIASHIYTTPGVYKVFFMATDNDGAMSNIIKNVTVLPSNSAPTSIFTFTPLSGAAPLEVSLDATGSVDSDGTIVSYEWSFSDGGNAQGQNVNYTFANPGSYNMTLTVTDNEGAQGISTQSITVDEPNSAPIAEFSFDPQSGQAPLTVSFDASASSDSDGTISSYAWDFGDGQSGTGANLTHIYSSSGTYTITLTLTDDDGASATKSLTITVSAENVSPSASFSVNPESGDYPLTVALDASASSDSDGTITEYNWSISGGTTLTGVTNSHTFTSEGTYTITLVVKDNSGATSTTSREVQVTKPNEAPVANFSFDPSTGKAPLLINFDGSASTDSDGSISSYNWDFGDGSSATGVTTSHTFATDGTFTVKLAVTDNKGATHELSKIVTILPTNKLPVPSFTITPESGVAPLEISLDAAASTDSDGTISSYSWSFSDGETSSGAQTTHTFNNAGTQQVTLTLTDSDGGQATLTKEVVVSAPNLAPIAEFTHDPTTGKAPLVVTFNGAGSYDQDGTIASYTWSFSDGGAASGQTTSYTFGSPGNHSATLTVTDDKGATGTKSVQVIVSEPNVLPQASFSITPNSGVAPLTVSLDATASSDSDGTIVTYEWAISDGGTTIGKTTNYTFSNAGEYTITLTVTDSDGGQSSSNQNISVEAANVAPVADFVFDPQTGDAPLTVNFDASSSSDSDGTIQSYAWDFGDGQSATGSTVSHTYTVSGDYTIILTVTDDKGAQATKELSLSVTPENISPSASFTVEPESGDYPLTITLDATASSDNDGTIASYDWTITGGVTLSGATATHTFNSEGTYTITLEVTDDDGAKTSTSRDVVVTKPNSLPTASFSFDPTTGKAPIVVTFDGSSSSDSDGTISSYEWTFPGDITITGSQVSHTFNQEGTFSIKLTVTDDRGGSFESIKSITILPSNVAPVALFVAAPESGEAPLTVNFDASTSSDSDGTISTYAWDFGDGNNGSGVTTSHTFNQAGTFTVSLTVTDSDGATASYSRDIIVDPANVAPTAIISAAPENGKAPLEVTFSGAGSTDSDGSIVDYKWMIEGSEKLGISVAHTFINGGTYPVSLTVTDDKGATNQTTYQMVVSSPNEAPVANFTITPGADELSINLDGSSSTDNDGTIVDYSWAISDGATYNGQNVSHRFEEIGEYTILLTVTDSDGATHQKIESIKITLPGELPIADLSYRQVGALLMFFDIRDTFYSMSYTPGDQSLRITLNYGDGNVDDLSERFRLHAYDSAGTYDVLLTVEDLETGLVATKSAQVSVDETVPAQVEPEAGFVYYNDQVATNVVIFEDISEDDGELASSQWDFGDGTTAVGEYAFHGYQTAGSYQVTLTVTDDEGLTSSDTRIVEVAGDGPSGLVVYSFCELDELNVSCSGNAFDDTYELESVVIDWGDGSSEEISMMTPNWSYITQGHTYGQNGIYQLTITARNVNGDEQVFADEIRADNEVPVADFYCSQSGREINCDASGSYDSDGFITDYQWSVSDGASYNGLTMNHSLASSGSYQVSLTVRDNQGVYASSSQNIVVVNASPTPVISCQSNTVNELVCDATSSTDDGTIVSFSWDFGDGSQSSGENVTHLYATGGSYTVQLTAVDDEGASATVSKSVAVVTNQAPNATFYCSSSTPLEMSCTAAASSDGDGTIVSYEWSFGDGNSATGEATSHTYVSGGYKDVSLTVTDDLGATDTTEKSVYVEEYFPPSISYTSCYSDYLVVYCDMYADVMPGETIDSIKWTMGDGEVEQGEDIVHTYPADGTYQINLEVIDSKGYSTDKNIEVTVADSIPPTAVIEVDNQSGNAPLAIRFSGASSTIGSTGTNIVSYSWDFGDGENGDGIYFDHTYTEVGEYTATLSITDSRGKVDQETIAISVSRLYLDPAPHFSYSVAENGDVTFDGSASLNDYRLVKTFKWDFGDGSDVEETSEPAIVHNYVWGTYQVTLTVVDMQDIEASITIETLVIVDPGEPGYTNFGGIDSDNDGLRDDVQLWIHERYKVPLEKKAITEVAKAQQTVLATSSDPEASKAASHDYLDRLQCLDWAMGTRFNEESLRLKAEMVNTRERILAVFESDYHFHGEPRRGLNHFEKRGKCNFDVDSY